MARPKQISLEKAQKMVTVERVLLIGLLSVLIEKGGINQQDIESLKKHCASFFRETQKSEQPLLRIHSEEVEIELAHLLAAFRLHA